MSVCPELIEETGRPPGLIFWYTGVFCPWLGQVRVLDENSHLWRNYDVNVTFMDYRKITFLATAQPLYMLDG